jgi:hypothetical protein
MTYTYGTNAMYELDKQVLQVIDESKKGDDYQKGNKNCKAKKHRDLFCSYFEIEYRNAVLSRET